MCLAMSSTSLDDDAATLFATIPSYEHRHAADPTAPQVRYWLGVFVRYRAPWFLLAWRRGASKPVETIIVAWSSVLLQLLGQLSEDQVVAIHVIAPSEAFGWEILPVSEVWEPAAKEAGHTGPLFLRVPGRGLLDYELEPACEDRTRRLVARLPRTVGLPLDLEPR